MDDLTTLFVLLLLFYLAECVVRTRRHGIAFCSGLGGGRRVREGNRLYGNDHYALLLANPLPLCGSVILSEQWPVSLGRDAVYSYVAQAFNPGPRPMQPEQFWRFEDIQKVTANGKRVLINGRPFANTNSRRFACHLAELITRIVRTPSDQRPAAILRALQAATDLGEARKRVELYRSGTMGLLVACNLLFLDLLVLCPILAYFRYLHLAWFELLVALLVLLVYATREFVRAHRRLYPEERSARWSEASTMLLFPPAAMRAHDRLSRDLLAGFHPLAVARVLCSEDDFKHLAASVWRDLIHPIQPACPSTLPEHRVVEQDFREQLGEVLGDLLRECGVDPARLPPAPVRDDQATRSYCPRCHCQFLVAEGTCSPCGNLPLAPLEDPPR